MVRFLSIMLALIAALLGGMPTSAFAETRSEQKEIERLTRMSDRVVVAEVIHVRIEVKPVGVYTVSTLLIQETLKGDRTPVFEVRLPGGKLGDRTFRRPGGLRFEEEQRVLVFLSGDRLTGSAEGAFYLDEDGRAVRNHIALYNQGHEELNRYEWNLVNIRNWVAKETR